MWLNLAGTAFRHLCLAFHHLKLPFHHLKLSFRHLVIDVPSPFGEKIIKIVATRGQISRLKCTKYYFGWGSAPDPAGGDYIARPEPLAGRGRPTYKGDGRKGRERGEDRGREGIERNVAFHHLLLSNLTTGVLFQLYFRLHDWWEWWHYSVAMMYRVRSHVSLFSILQCTVVGVNTVIGDCDDSIFRRQLHSLAVIY